MNNSKASQTVLSTFILYNQVVDQNKSLEQLSDPF